VTGRPRSRGSGEGSIFPYRNGFAAYAWVRTPEGQRKRRWVYGPTREAVYDKWVKLQAKASAGPLPTTTPTVAEYLHYWLAEVIKPNREPNTYSHYELMSRLHVIPGVGQKHLDRLTVRDVQSWLNKLPDICQCCAQGKDEMRAEQHKDPRKRRRCCAIGQCCEDYPSRRTIQAARNTLRAALNHAIGEELLSRNVAEMVKLPATRKTSKRGQSWTVEEARRFLESAHTDNDPLYAIWVLILVLGLRKGEVLGLTWPTIDIGAAEVSLEWQLQRVGTQLIHKRQTKTDGSTDVLPLPDICLAALQFQKDRQDGMRSRDWPEKCICGGGHRLVFTTRNGRPIEPRNINRSFDSRCEKAGVHRIRVHDTRRTCGSLLAALDVHPRVAMQILRHAQIAITMEIYTQVPDEVTRAALKRLSDRLSKGVPRSQPRTPRRHPGQVDDDHGPVRP
jgi:integrase